MATRGEMPDDPPPPGLDELRADLWRQVTKTLWLHGGHATGLGLTCLHVREVLRLEAQISRLQDALHARDATIRMACDRLGGLVEGQPPHAGNFLQRIDELTAVVG